MIGHMQIRAKHVTHLKRWGHVIACIDLFRNISVDLQRRYLLPGVTSSTLAILLHLSPASSQAVISSPSPFLLPLSIHSWVCFIFFSPFNSRFSFSLPSRFWFFFILHIIMPSQLDLLPKPLNNLPPVLPSSVAFPLPHRLRLPSSLWSLFLHSP